MSVAVTAWVGGALLALRWSLAQKVGAARLLLTAGS